jgi:diguanylate cyclase (GGDEF)-like protein
MTLMDVVLALVLAVIADLLADWSTALSAWMAKRAARRLPAKYDSRRYEEEWLETLYTQPRLLRPWFAIGLMWTSLVIGARGPRKRDSNQPLRISPSARTAEISLVRRTLIRWLSPPPIDELTGAYNRRQLMDLLPRQIERAHRSGRPVSVLFLDLDRFKRINDQHGHLAGDDVLRCLAQLLRASIGRHDSIARYGGEEFVIVLADTDLCEALKTAERIRAACAAAILVTECGELRITASFGVAALAARPGAAETAEAILQRADMALYEAKGAGRNCVRAAAETSTQGD